MQVTDLNELDGRIVLVRSARDHRNPETAVRGTLVVRSTSEGRQVVEVAFDFPQMFTTRARHRTVALDETAIAQLLASESDGTYSVTLDDPLNPEAPAGDE